MVIVQAIIITKGNKERQRSEPDDVTRLVKSTSRFILVNACQYLVSLSNVKQVIAYLKDCL